MSGLTLLYWIEAHAVSPDSNSRLFTPNQTIFTPDQTMSLYPLGLLLLYPIDACFRTNWGMLACCYTRFKHAIMLSYPIKASSNTLNWSMLLCHYTYISLPLAVIPNQRMLLYPIESSYYTQLKHILLYPIEALLLLPIDAFYCTTIKAFSHAYIGNFKAGSYTHNCAMPFKLYPGEAVLLYAIDACA